MSDSNFDGLSYLIEVAESHKGLNLVVLIDGKFIRIRGTLDYWYSNREVEHVLTVKEYLMTRSNLLKASMIKRVVEKIIDDIKH